ncbi:hypothetical protein CGLO_12878 [Colletotrichum gloeosporioides Cg-14]|uniref:Uncharacterized protein n=1 Tax=Colletotrichum gloeosporioides (strain Cg-14) TaxID=1237896 RepID=T0K7K0_COLGC|nr:hypothetical protein CGLO_12878 [Colletotrichum gloeosporioides Cg-14]
MYSFSFDKNCPVFPFALFEPWSNDGIVPEDELSVSGREDSVFSAGLLAELDLDISLSFDYPEAPLLTNTLDDMWVEENYVNNVTDAGLFDFTSNEDCSLEDFDLDDDLQGL